jgi:hypothetical protein
MSPAQAAPPPAWQGFSDEAPGVLGAGLETARWVTVDDTSARHKAGNGVTTQIGNDHFTWFATTGSKRRLNFLQLLRPRPPPRPP